MHGLYSTISCKVKMCMLYTYIIYIPSMYKQEYIRDKSVQPRIPTVNHILQKWCSKTSRVGMVTIILFLRIT